MPVALTAGSCDGAERLQLEPYLSHAHQRGLPQLLDNVARCRLLGTDPTLEGELPLAR